MRKLSLEVTPTYDSFELEVDLDDLESYKTCTTRDWVEQVFTSKLDHETHYYSYNGPKLRYIVDKICEELGITEE